MGRVKHYTRGHKKHNKKQAKKGNHDDIPEAIDIPKTTTEAALSVGKKKQLFKKEKARDIKAKI